MKKILLIIFMTAMALSISALPEWPRKYATTIVRGRVFNLPKDMGEILRVSSAPTLLKSLTPDDVDEHADADGTRVFSVKWPMCWPMEVYITLCNYSINLPLCPGDTIDIEMDYLQLKELNDVRQIHPEAIKISGLSFYSSPTCIGMANKMSSEAAVIDKDYVQKHCRANFNAYREWKWKKCKDWMKQIKAAKLKDDEKDYLRLKMEKIYVNGLYSYDFMMKFIGCDSTEMSTPKAQFNLRDPHAASLNFPKHTTSAYVFGPKCMKYLEANGLAGLPLGQYLREREQAETVVAQLKASHSVSEAEISRLAPEFQQPVHELQQQIAEKMKKKRFAVSNWKPAGTPGTWLQQIVSRHAGNVVFIDFWATWCGPCQTGIREMATVKEEYKKRGVDFVYITDNSSSMEGFLEIQQKHAGEHFLFLKDEIKAMNIPGYSGAIPHYLLYGRDGKLVKYIVGWPGLKNMEQELNKALEK
jgi:thiol-disulfide isomerase/thioredoxin